jgi:hypothetical protein
MSTSLHFFELIQNHGCAFFVLAALFSVFWGIHGVSYAIKDDKKKYDDFHDKVILGGYFISEFIGSFFGWVSLYVLSIHVIDSPSSIGTVDVLLILGAFVGMSGWAYRIFELIETLVGKIKVGGSK